jgi:hypothetical protein
MLTVQDNLNIMYFFFCIFKSSICLSNLLLHFKNPLKLNSPETFRIQRAPPGNDALFSKIPGERWEKRHGESEETESMVQGWFECNGVKKA